jgi:hypothetical protein
VRSARLLFVFGSKGAVMLGDELSAVMSGVDAVVTAQASVLDACCEVWAPRYREAAIVGLAVDARRPVPRATSPPSGARSARSAAPAPPSSMPTPAG